jgi:hypothetical protein
MSRKFRLGASLCALLLLAACAGTDVTSRQAYEGDKLPRPDRIIVHDFGNTPADVPPGSALAAQPAVSETAAEAEIAQKLGAQIAEELVADLQGMGLPAVRAAGQPAPKVNDVVLRGYFVTVDQGSQGEQLLIGFGSGAAKLTTVVEGYQMTPTGLRKLGGGELASHGPQTPGVIAPLAVLAATSNPIGLVVGGAVQARNEYTGADTIEAAAKRTADEIFAQMRPTIERQDWT